MARKLELLSPAANLETAKAAVMHGADAVYIGPPSHGARKSVANSIEDIEELVDFAHNYRVKIYATVNTIIFDNEIKKIETLCRDLYHAGVDALIVQDMGLLRMKIPPIALHASTQCDIRTPEKARFLQEVGFSQLVLARELTLKEIKAIADSVTIPIETFVHGALCVCYSGRCQASYAINGRSANRGECAQICRYPYTLVDSNEKIICKDKYLLSLKDFNASNNLEDLIEAGVSSFKIEGRLKDIGYVKNITALYNNKLNNIIRENPDLSRSSYGNIELKFEPKADKSFNRGFTTYFLEKRRPLEIVSLHTPKSQGELVRKISDLNNGDGISFYDKNGEFTGVNVNRVENNRIIPARKIEIPSKTDLYRTSDVKWNKLINSATAERKIDLNIEINPNSLIGSDERGVEAGVCNELNFSPSRSKMDYKPVFEKLGGTHYRLQKFINNLPEERFYRLSEMTSLRRSLIELLDKSNKTTYPYQYRRKENVDFKYPEEKLDSRDNVANKLAEKFYREHGIKEIEFAAEKRG
ncbi:MAG: U32 family peptidase, partial [Muribaculaceae bacterium]|nr:U32 family peptidase [Muribaculaceae bacterium]